MKLGRALALLLCCSGLPACEGNLLHGETSESPPSPEASAADTFASDRVSDRFETPRGPLVLIPIEHATFLLGWQGKAIYFDPADRNLSDAKLPMADAILITDTHYDHFDPVYVARLRQPRTVVVGPEAASERAPMVVMHNGEKHDVLGIEVTAVPAYNVTRGPVDGVRYHEKGHNNGYLLDFGGYRVYVSGDTDCTPEMEALGPVDVAFLGMNVPYAMTPPEASACIAAFHPSIVIPYAYRHADLSTLDRAKMGPGVRVLRRDFYAPINELRQHAYQVLVQGMWGWADDLLDLAKLRDPKGDEDWRVQMTRRWLREYERPWPL